MEEAIAETRRTIEPELILWFGQEFRDGQKMSPCRRGGEPNKSDRGSAQGADPARFPPNAAETGAAPQVHRFVRA